MAISGFSMGSGWGENLGFGVFSLKKWEERKGAEESIENIMQTIQKLAYTIPSADIRVIQPPAIMGLGTTGGVSFMLQAKAGQTPEELGDAADLLVQELMSRPET